MKSIGQKTPISTVLGMGELVRINLMQIGRVGYVLNKAIMLSRPDCIQAETQIDK